MEKKVEKKLVALAKQIRSTSQGNPLKINFSYKNADLIIFSGEPDENLPGSSALYLSELETTLEEITALWEDNGNGCDFYIIEDYRDLSLTIDIKGTRDEIGNWMEVHKNDSDETLIRLRDNMVIIENYEYAAVLRDILQSRLGEN
jgi:hypothetical protein